jgi:hypothetical protein
MWPFKDSIPLVKSISENELNEIEIIHSTGQFKINKKDIVNISHSSDLSGYKENFKKEMWRKNGIFIFGGNSIQVSIPIFFAYINLLNYLTYRNYDELLFTIFPTGINRLFTWPLLIVSVWILSTLTAYILRICLSYVFRVFRDENFFKNILIIQTVGNNFKFKIQEGMSFHSSILPEANVDDQIAKKKYISVDIVLNILFFLIPFLSMFFYWHESFLCWEIIENIPRYKEFWDVGNRYNFLDYYSSEKNLFSLLFEGMVSFWYNFLFLMLIVFSIIIFFGCLLLLLAIVLFQIILGPCFAGILSGILLKIIGKTNFSFKELGYFSLLFGIFFPFLFPPFNFGEFNGKPINIRKILIGLSSLFLLIGTVFISHKLLYDVIYIPVHNQMIDLKNWFDIHIPTIGGSIFQFDKSFYLFIILFLSYSLLAIVIPKPYIFSETTGEKVKGDRIYQIMGPILENILHLLRFIFGN